MFFSGSSKEEMNVALGWIKAQDPECRQN
uniref:Uncharacterized protein n=1 Tax=Anguilla anguilla TaxID=7936 RepID=A0A0E9U8U7_ANGAN